jgi:hypothetical protein
MSERTRVSHPIYNLQPTEIEGFDSLAELALDTCWGLHCLAEMVTPAIAAHRVRFFASYKVSAPGNAFNSRLYKELPSISYFRRRLLSRAIRGS